MAEKVDKVILTNFQALKKKYGAQGFGAVGAAVDALIAADKSRGLHTRLVALDDKAEMQTLRAPVVTRPPIRARTSVRSTRYFARSARTISFSWDRPMLFRTRI